MPAGVSVGLFHIFALNKHEVCSRSGFSQRCCSWSKSSRYVVAYVPAFRNMVTSSWGSEGRFDYLILKTKELLYFEMSAVIYAATHCNIPEDVKYCEIECVCACLTLLPVRFLSALLRYCLQTLRNSIPEEASLGVFCLQFAVWDVQTFVVPILGIVYRPWMYWLCLRVAVLCVVYVT
jgi:hypothetical protein